MNLKLIFKGDLNFLLIYMGDISFILDHQIKGFAKKKSQ